MEADLVALEWFTADVATVSGVVNAQC